MIPIYRSTTSSIIFIVPPRAMFSLIVGFWQALFRKVEFQVLILGLDRAGKTSTLEQMKAAMEEQCNAKLRAGGHSEMIVEEMIGGRLYTGVRVSSLRLASPRFSSPRFASLRFASLRFASLLFSSRPPLDATGPRRATTAAPRRRDAASSARAHTRSLALCLWGRS